MIEELDIETYLYISHNKFEIFLYDKKKSVNLYNEKFINTDNPNYINYNLLDNFLNSNIFKIEKLIDNFIKNIYLIIESDNFLTVNFGIKKKNYDTIVNLENLLVESKDLFEKNYQNQKIIHMLVNKYKINGADVSSFDDNTNCKDFSLEVEFIYLPNSFLSGINKTLEKYQIKIARYFDANYLQKTFKGQDIDFPRMIFNIQNGFNQNEVSLIPKNNKNTGFFEKFFQFFS